MRPRLVHAVVLVAGLLAPAVGRAATCTVSDLRVIVRSVDLEGIVPVVGLMLPATVDEAAGTFALDLSTFPNTTFQIVVDNALDFEPRTFTGTIDGAGNVLLPAVQMNLTTAFGGGGTVVATPDVSTGLASANATGRDFATQGTPLDFGTGDLVLEGHVVIVAAPGSPGALTAGLRLACRLDPIPDRTKLPGGPALTSATGKAKLAKSGATTGDTLKLVAKLLPGAVPFATPGGLFVRIRDGGGRDMVLARADVTLGAKKTTLADADPQGKTIRVVTGRKSNGMESAPLDGKITIKQTKKSVVLTFTESGLDLAALAAGPATVTIGMGPAAPSDGVTVRRTTSKLSFK